MATTTDLELEQLESTYWDAMQRKDADAAMRLTDDACVIVGPSGIDIVDPERIRSMVENATFDLTHYAFDDKTFRVRRLTDDVAIVAYSVTEDLVVDARPERIAAYEASVWVRRGGEWRCALHAEALRQ